MSLDALYVSPLRRSLVPESKLDPLRDRLSAVVTDSVRELLDPERIDALAEDLRVVTRHRVHHPGLVVASVVLTALERQSDTSGRWLDAQTAYCDLGGPRGAPSGFAKQVDKLLPVFQTMLTRRARAIARETKDETLRGRLAAFADVLVPDGCAFKLASVLSGYCPGTGTPAGLKLHAVYSLKTGIATAHATAGSVHDNDGFWPKTWENGALYLWDLGYNDTTRFVDATLAGAHVVQRLKSGSNPKVLGYVGEGGSYHHVDKMRLNEVCEGLVAQTGPLDIDVELRDERGRKSRARVVCVPFGGEDRYYLTTLPREAFTVFDVAEMYRVRWEIELLFRSWKGALRMDDVHRLRKPSSVQVHVTASLLAALLARDLHAGLERLRDEAAAAGTAQAFSPSAA